MKITRHVIYDLLPAYFAGEVSADTRALVDEFMASDPELSRMAARFKTLLEERAESSADDADVVREREAFSRARAAANLKVNARTSAAAWGLAGAFSWIIAFVTWNPEMGWWNPGAILGAFFSGGAMVTFVASFHVTPESWWRPLVGLDDDTIRSLGSWRSGGRRS
jgi:anti-sigma factor RsiW